MEIGLIGAGAIGGALAQDLTKLGDQVAIANSRGPDTSKDVAAKTGTLDESRRQEPGTPVYGTDLDAAELKKALARAERGKGGRCTRDDRVLVGGHGRIPRQLAIALR